MFLQQFSTNGIAVVGEVAAEDGGQMEVSAVVAAQIVYAVSDGDSELVQKCQIVG